MHFGDIDLDIQIKVKGEVVAPLSEEFRACMRLRLFMLYLA